MSFLFLLSLLAFCSLTLHGLHSSFLLAPLVFCSLTLYGLYSSFGIKNLDTCLLAVFLPCLIFVFFFFLWVYSLQHRHLIFCCHHFCNQDSGILERLYNVTGETWFPGASWFTFSFISLQGNMIGGVNLPGRCRFLITFTRFLAIQSLPCLFKCSPWLVWNLLFTGMLRTFTWLKVVARLCNLLFRRVTSLFTHEDGDRSCLCGVI